MSLNVTNDVVAFLFRNDSIKIDENILPKILILESLIIEISNFLPGNVNDLNSDEANIVDLFEN